MSSVLEENCPAVGEITECRWVPVTPIQEHGTLDVDDTIDMSNVVESHTAPSEPEPSSRSRYITTVLANKRKDNSQVQPVTTIEKEITMYLHHPTVEESEALDFDPVNYWSSNEVKQPLLFSFAEYFVIKHTFHQLTWWSAIYYKLNEICKTST